MPLILNVLGGISLVVGLLALVMRFVDQTGFDFSYAFAYQAITGGVLLIAFGKLLKHVADTDANTTRMAQSLMLGGGNIRGIGDQGDAAPAPQAAIETAAAPVAAEPATPEPVAAEPALETEPAPAAEPALEPEPAPAAEPALEPEPAQAPAQTPLTATMSADPVETPATPDEPAVAAEPAAEEAAPEEAVAVDSTPVEQLEVRGYMVDVFSDGTVDVHTAEGAMRFESLSAFKRELDRAAG
ncbi:MAG: hypothetical protein ACR2OR_18060 [Hyphomicrobiales bacterium]